MKKTLALLLVLVMLFSFAACGEAEKKQDESNKTSATAETATAEAGKNAISIPLGKFEGSQYTSTYNGLTVNLPGDEWSFFDAEALADEMGIPVSNLEANVANALEQVNVAYDAMASDGSTGSEFEVAYQLGKTPEQHMKAEKAALDKLSGLEYEVLEEKTVTLCGNEYTMMVLEAEAVGTNTTRLYLARTNEDNVLISVYLNMFGNYEVSELLGYFA